MWGGRSLEQLYGKTLPPSVPIGESWEITDRPEGVSVINRGPLASKDLRWLVEHHQEELMGAVPLLNGRFPLLAKILDARDHKRNCQRTTHNSAEQQDQTGLG